MTVNENSIYDRIIDSVPGLIEKFTDTFKPDEKDGSKKESKNSDHVEIDENDKNENSSSGNSGYPEAEAF